MTTFILIVLGVVVWIWWFKKLLKKTEGQNSSGSGDIGKQNPASKSTESPKAAVAEEADSNIWESNIPYPVRSSIKIDYKDASGSKTERVVDVLRFDLDAPGGLFYGFCHLRKSTRTFRYDRVMACCDAETGEVVSDVCSFLGIKYKESPEYSADKLLESEYDVLRILLYMGKADGALRAAEKLIIRRVCRELSEDSRISDNLIDRIFSEMEIPSIHAFHMAVGRVATLSPQKRKSVLEAAAEIVATQKTVHPAEQEAMDYMRQKFE